MKTGYDFSKVSKFNFTYAMPGGAWLEWPAVLTSGGMVTPRDWFSFTEIAKQLGQIWIDRQLKRQGWMTGCWIQVS